MAGRIAYYGGIVKGGLVLDLDAAKKDSYPGAGTVWNDISGTNITGSLINGPTFSTSGSGAIILDGTNDSISIPYTIQNQFTNQISINVWINAKWFDTGNNDGVAIIGKNHTSLNSPYTVWGMGLSQAGNYGGNIGNGSTRTTINSASTLSLNTWYNLCLTYDGTTIKLYRNGTQDANTATGTYTLGQNAIDISIGNNPMLGPTYYDWFKGNISIAHLYNRALSQAEITQNYNATKTRFGL